MRESKRSILLTICAIALLSLFSCSLTEPIDIPEGVAAAPMPSFTLVYFPRESGRPHAHWKLTKYRTFVGQFYVNGERIRTFCRDLPTDTVSYNRLYEGTEAFVGDLLTTKDTSIVLVNY